MAKNQGNRRTTGTQAPLVSVERKKEILGLLLMLVALMVSLAVVTFTAADNHLAERFSLRQAFDPGNVRAENALGLLGASIARLLVTEFLGYLSLVIPLVVGAWGFLLFRHRRIRSLSFASILTLVGGFLVASLVGWVGHAADADVGAWSGAWGTGTAAWMTHIVGTAGSILILVFGLLVLALLFVDRDIQRSFDRIGDLVRRATAWTKSQMLTWRMARQERKKSKAEQARIAERTASQTHKSPTEKPARAARPDPSPTRQNGETRTLQTERPRAPVGATIEDERPVLPSREQATAGREIEFSVSERIEVERARSIERDIEDPAEDVAFVMPDLDLLDEEDNGGPGIDYEELEENKRVLLDKLATYSIEIVAINAIVGPTVTLYELTPAPGVKISRITALEDDLAMAMAARGIRMIAPIPGKSAIGVEIPNRHRELVHVRDVLGTTAFNEADINLPLVLGKTIEGDVFIEDLTRMPHLLIAGATGSGKSVGLNACITGLLYACHPSNLKFVMIDPKKIELQPYERIIDHYLALPEDADDAVITDVEQALAALKCCEKEMEMRYDLLSKAQVRGVQEYNDRVASGMFGDSDLHRHLPHIVVVVDELADLMMTAGKEIEGPIARLAQMSRAVGIHLILATQRPSVDVITGLIKANFPSRIAYQVATKVDSRTILDQNGAQGLVGNGDLLYLSGSHILRLQGPFVSVEEVDRITRFIARQPGTGPYHLPKPDDKSGVGLSIDASSERDELFEDAARIIVRSQQGSVSLLQRKLSVGYSRAARIVDQLEDAGIVGPFEGSKARQVLVADDMALDAFFASDG